MVAEIRAITPDLPQRIVANEELDREHPEWKLEVIALVTRLRQAEGVGVSSQ